MKNEHKIDYIDKPDEKDFPKPDVAELVQVLLESEITMNSDATRSAAASVLNNEDLQWVTENMCKFRDDGNTIIAKDGKKTVGMIAFQEHEIITPTGQRIFEIRRNTVLPDYRGQHIGRELRESMIRRIQNIDRDALMISKIHKKNDVNQNLSKSTQFRLVTEKEDMKNLGFSDKWIESNERNRYEVYIFDPRNEILDMLKNLREDKSQ